MTDLTPPDERRAPGLRLHARTMHVQSARAKFGMLALEFEEEHDLTLTEMAIVLTEVLEHVHKVMLRIERHGTPDKKADEA
jgi:hypothetical protein